MGSPSGTNGVSEIIRQAEKQIAGNNLVEARELLTKARLTYPDNDYISAIIERVDMLENKTRPAQPAAGSVSVSVPKGTPARPDQLALQVKRLAQMACTLMERGSTSAAFESLMNAYLLDPLSSDVQEAERMILPAIDLMRQRGTLNQLEPTPPQAMPQIAGSEGSAPSEESRVEQLKQQKERERLEKERAMWRKASEAPRQPQQSGGQSGVRPAGELVTPSGKPSAGFLDRFRKGKPNG
jgi:hypothetical protein